MKFTLIMAAAALLSSSEAIKIVSNNLTLDSDKPPPTSADTPNSAYFGADEDDVMNNIFNHYGVPITNAAGVPTG